GLRDQPAQRLAAPQPARPGHREARAHPPGYLFRRRAPRLRSPGLRTGSPASTAARRSAAPCPARASTSVVTEGVPAWTSTRRPNSLAVFAVCGPIAAITVTACGLPAIPIRVRTVDEEVNSTASK